MTHITVRVNDKEGNKVSEYVFQDAEWTSIPDSEHNGETITITDNTRVKLPI